MRLIYVNSSKVTKLEQKMNNSESFFASPEKFTQVHLRGIVTEPKIWRMFSENVSPVLHCGYLCEATSFIMKK